jgi:hypothetical protein
MTVPAALYRNAIDLNRYSNKVAKDIIVVYNDIIIDAANQLQNLLQMQAVKEDLRLVHQQKQLGYVQYLRSYAIA